MRRDFKVLIKIVGEFFWWAFWGGKILAGTFLGLIKAVNFSVKQLNLNLFHTGDIFSATCKIFQKYHLF